MPSTITAFHTFQPATKARSSQVNANFSNYRGDLLPINETTATASDGTHYLGASDHYWAGAYAKFIDMGGATTTARTIFRPLSSATTGGSEILFGANTAAVLLPGSLRFKGQTSTVDPVFEIDQANTTGHFALKFGSSTIAAWDADGLQPEGIDVAKVTTSSSLVGHCVYSGLTTLAAVGSDSTTGQTLTQNRIMARGGGLIEFNIVNSRMSTAASLNNAHFIVDVYRGNTTTAMALTFSRLINLSSQNTTTGSVGGSIDLRYIDNSYSSGELIYRTMLRALAGNATSDSFSCTAAVFIKEI